MDEKALIFVNQLIDKTKLDKLSWSTGFEDGQFKTLLPGGNLAFVVQVKGEVRRFQMLDDRSETILERTITHDQICIDHVQSGSDQLEALFEAIGSLEALARSHALQVNQKLDQAEKLLAAI